MIEPHRDNSAEVAGWRCAFGGEPICGDRSGRLPQSLSSWMNSVRFRVPLTPRNDSALRSAGFGFAGRCRLGTPSARSV